MLKYFQKNIKSSVILLCAAFFLGGFLFDRLLTQPIIIRSKVLRESGYEYINPVLLCNIDNNQKYNENTEISKKISAYIEGQSANDISVYFLSLSGKGWASVNGDDAYSPASMLKMPAVMETLKFSESNPVLLSKRVYFDGSFEQNNAEFFDPKQSIKVGRSYTLDELLPYIMKYSDNNAMQVLDDNVHLNDLTKIYKDLNIDIPQNTLDIMSAKTYSLFLRILYNSTYLTRENSERVLKLMVESDFPYGLRAGVPKGVTVAEKFGERQIFSPTGELEGRELHDCGIVYLEDEAYVLCVMTRGQDFESLANSIKEISSIVYASNVK